MISIEFHPVLWWLSLATIVFFCLKFWQSWFAILGNISGLIVTLFVCELVRLELYDYEIALTHFIQNIGFTLKLKLALFLMINAGLPLINFYSYGANSIKARVGITPHRYLAEFFRDKSRLKKAFRGGANVIDQLSKYFIIITALIWLFGQRRSDEIKKSWDNIRNSAGFTAELGRVNSLEKLHGYNQQLNRLDFTGVDLQDLYLSFGYRDSKKAQLNGTIFNHSYLEKANFQGASLIESSFTGAQLFQTDFSFSNLERADLRGAVYGTHSYRFLTSFIGSNLRGADLRDPLPESNESVIRRFNPYTGKNVNLGGAYLVDANLSGAKLGKLVTGVYLDSSAFKFPAGHQKFWNEFAINNVLASKAWDATTVFPETIDAYLRKNGIREKRPAEGEANYEMVSEARENVLDFIKTFKVDKGFYYRIQYQRDREEWDTNNNEYLRSLDGQASQRP